MSVINPGREGRVASRHFGTIVVTLAAAAAAVAIAAPVASASVPGDGGSTPCVKQTFGKSNTYQACVGALQVLLNDLRNAYLAHQISVNYGPDRILKTDGLYGNNTWSDVYAVNKARTGGHLLDGTTTPDTWSYVCGGMWANGLYHGSTYYYVANCDVLYGANSSPPPAPPTGQQMGSTSPGQQIGSTSPPCPGAGAVPQPPGSGPPSGSGPRPGRWIRHASWEYERYQDNPPRCGWTLHVTPTLAARIGNAVVARQGWQELYRDYKNVAHGITHNVDGLMKQYECHAAVVAIDSPRKPTWNLDEWRPDVSFPATVRARCNP